MSSYNPRSLWDNVDMRRTRFDRFKFLTWHRTQAFKDLSKDSGLPDNTKAKDRLTWILRNKKEFAGKQSEDKYYKMNHHLASFSFITLNDRKKDSMTDDELDEKGLTEDIFKITLKYLSEFLAWEYNLLIPQNIEEIYRDDMDITKDASEIERELAQLNSEQDLSDNPSPRFPAIIIIDNALYMDGRLEGLEDGLQDLFEEIKSNARLAGAIELYVATCGGKVTEIVDFSTIDRQGIRLNDLDLRPYGTSKMASAIDTSLKKLDKRIDQMRNGDVDVDYYCPWMIILSDGKFGEDITQACERLDRLKANDDIQVYPIGITSKARLDQLKRLDKDEAGILKSFKGFFTDVFNSMKLSQVSSPGGTRISIVHQESFTKEKL